MAYIGRQLARGTNRLFDDISSSFNGSTTVFNLTIASVATATATPFQLFVSLGGVMQKPSTDFTTAGNQITFTTAPAAGLSCWIMMQGDTIDQAAISDASVTPSKISNSGDFAFPADIRLKDGDGSHYVGFQSATTVSNSLVWTLPATDGSANQYLKTDGSGTLSWGSDSTSDPSKMPLAGGTFTGDVTFTGDASNGLWDKSASAFVANLTGNVTGNASGSAATVTGSAQSAITSLGTLTGLTVAGNATLNAQGDLRFADSDSSNWVAFQAPATIGSNVTWTLPAADGSANQLLTTNGSGTLSWSTVAGGLSSDAQLNTVGGTDAGDFFDANSTYNTALGYEAMKGGGGTSVSRNTAIGYRALRFLNSPAGDNTAVGAFAGYSLTSGEDNTFIGKSAGYSLTSGDFNIAIGEDSFGGTCTGTNNIAIGRETFDALTSGNENVAIGYKSSKALTTGYSNVAIGGYSLLTATTGYRNVIIGPEAGYYLTTGNSNVCIGYQAGIDITTANGCTFVGSYAGENVTTATYNTGFGRSALSGGSSGVTGNSNAAFGLSPLGALTSGQQNNAFGRNALRYLTTGNDNSAFGYQAGEYMTTGSNNTCLGKLAGQTGSPSGQITTGSNNVVLGDNNVTNLYCADTSISSSDSRDKTDVTNFTHGLNWVNQLNPITYRWDKRSWYDDNTPDGSKKRNKKHIGFLAQDVLAIEGNTTDKDDMLVVNLNEDDSAYGLKYERLVPVLVNAIKELSTEVTTLKTKVATLESA
tara:strand:- start:541 stop:2814 length:2274 start_codon:yes stop_codon:yes gene_type:complete